MRARAKVGKLEAAHLVDEEVLRLQVTVHDAALVAEVDAKEHLVDVRFDEHRLEGFRETRNPCASSGLGRGTQRQLGTVVAVLNVLELGGVQVLQRLEHRDLAKGRRRDALVFKPRDESSSGPRSRRSRCAWPCEGRRRRALAGGFSIFLYFARTWLMVACGERGECLAGDGHSCGVANGIQMFDPDSSGVGLLGKRRSSLLNVLLVNVLNV